MIKRDAKALAAMLHDDFCGFGKGLDEGYANKEEGMAIFARDIASAPQPSDLVLHEKNMVVLDSSNALV